MPITIDFCNAPDGLVNTDNQGKVISADLDRWRTIVAAMRNNTDVKDGQKPDYFTNLRGTPHLRGEANNSARSPEPAQLANWIESQLPMKILSWNVGTKYGEERQAYFWRAFQEHVRYGENSCDVYCLQEVPLVPPSCHGNKNPPEFVHSGCFGEGKLNGFFNDYYLMHTVGKEYCMVTLIRKSLLDERPSCVNISLHHNFYFAQKISMRIGGREVVIFNVHLKAFEEQNGQDKHASTRDKQLAELGKLSKFRDFFCGDFNMIRVRDETDPRPGMNGIDWLKVAGDAGSTYFNVGENPEDAGAKEYDYIGVRQDAEPCPFERTVLPPGKSGSTGSWRHHPVVAEITIP